MNVIPAWSAQGSFFENCNCELLCRAHIHFTKPCDHVRCLGHWAFHLDEGRFGDAILNDLNVFVIGDSPQVMAEGNWTQAIYIDQRAQPPQRQALEAILTGKAGSTWAKLAMLVQTRLPTRFVPMSYACDGKRWSMTVEGVAETFAEPIRGAAKGKHVLGYNMFNQIHGDPQIFATGNTRFADHDITLSTEGTHAIISEFHWTGP